MNTSDSTSPSHPTLQSPPLVSIPDDGLSPSCAPPKDERPVTVELALPGQDLLTALKNDLAAIPSRSAHEHVHRGDADLLHVHVRPSTCRLIIENDASKARVWREIRKAIEHASSTGFQPTLRNGRVLDLTGRPALMGVLNVTPDSFSDGGRFLNPDTAVERALELQEHGASIIDVGGESTRPGAEPVPASEEMDRVCPVIERAAPELDVPISVDTRKPEVARAALDVGAGMLNDVGGLQDAPDLIDVAASFDVPAVAMHMQGTPRTMQDQPTYDHVVHDVASFLRTSRRRAVNGGLDPDQVILDPGIGFGKTQDHNLRLLREMDRFHSLGSPLMLGTSRKSFIGRILNTPVDQRVEGTIASIARPVLKGTHIVRVHDVRPTYRFLKVLWTLHGSSPWRERLVRDVDASSADEK